MAATTNNDHNSLAATALLQASWNHDLVTLGSLLPTVSANIQEPDTLQSPLHKAVLSLKDIRDRHSASIPEQRLSRAEETIRTLLANGAIWNDLDSNNMTSGCYAYELGDDYRQLYEIIVDAGVRAELLFQTLNGYVMLEEGQDTEDDDDDNCEQEEKDRNNNSTQHEVDNYERCAQKSPRTKSDTAAISITDDTLAQISEHQESDHLSFAAEISASAMSSRFLSSRLTYHTDKLLDSSFNGVMMAWEDNIMYLSASHLLRADQPNPPKSLRILNVGYGLGLFDSHIQSHPTHKPTEHTIIEPHPDVLSRIRESGFDKKSGVRILEGRWQDVLPGLVTQNEVYDGIYFDTFAEDYSAFREFFQEYVIAILNPKGGRFSFFNGLGADRKVCYDVYQKVLQAHSPNTTPWSSNEILLNTGIHARFPQLQVLELDLFEAGLDVEWQNIPISPEEGAWDGIRRKYWVLEEYRLPTCTFSDGM